MMVEGGAVEVMVRRREGMEKVVEEMPGLWWGVSVGSVDRLFGDWGSWGGEEGEEKGGGERKRGGRAWLGAEADRRVWTRRT